MSEPQRALGAAGEPGGGEQPAPAISVVVPSHDRPLRLRWLLNALEDQTLDREQWEVVVCHDSRGRRPAELLRDHPLAAAGMLGGLDDRGGARAGAQAQPGVAGGPGAADRVHRRRLPPTAGVAGQRTGGGAGQPGAIVQGATRPDPDELGVLHAGPRMRSQEIDPPVRLGADLQHRVPAAACSRPSAGSTTSSTGSRTSSWRVGPGLRAPPTSAHRTC